MEFYGIVNKRRTIRKATIEGLSCSMRIPLNQEHDIVKEKLKVPAIYMIPIFIGIGYANPTEEILEQYQPDINKQYM